MRHFSRSFSARALRRAVLGLVLVSVVVGVAGTGCDHEAQTAFREAAVGPIGDGVRTTMNGVLDGIIAALEDAGDGSTTQ
jgi:hypothetical protein